MKKDLEILGLFDLYGGLLTQKQWDIFSQYYECDLSLSEIGQNLEISRQAVKDSIDSSLKLLNQLESKLRLGYIKSELIRAQNSDGEMKSIIENLIKIM